MENIRKQILDLSSPPIRRRKDQDKHHELQKKSEGQKKMEENY